jgi:hypothetical protein
LDYKAILDEMVASGRFFEGKIKWELGFQGHEFVWGFGQLWRWCLGSGGGWAEQKRGGWVKFVFFLLKNLKDFFY